MVWFCFRVQLDQKNSVGDGKNNQDGSNSADKKKPHIKKPLNAFMLYMKEMRAKVVAECTLKESAAINQILGRRVRKSFYCDNSVERYFDCVRMYVVVESVDFDFIN